MHFGDELAHNPTMMSLEAQVGYSNGEKYFQKNSEQIEYVSLLDELKI